MSNPSIWLMICNTIRIACFVGLAMFFDKWWIALFSALFLVSLDNKQVDKGDNIK